VDAEQTNSRPKVFFYHGGPGAIISTYRKWVEGDRDALGEVSVAFSAQFYNLCESLDLQAYVVSANPNEELLREGRYTLEHRPKPAWCRGGGLRYHVGHAWYTFGLILSCLRFRSAIAIVVPEATATPLWAIVRLFGIRIVTVHHCTFWPAGFRPSGRKAQLTHRIDGWFWEHFVDAALGVSPECIRQVRSIAPRFKGPSVVGFAYFRRDYFDAIPPPPEQRSPFRVMFAGRMEENKGVFDIVRMARMLEDARPGAFRWELCGDGGALAELKAMVKQQGVTDVITLRGHLAPGQMAEAYGRSHAVITPTTSRFSEGMNQVAVEAILAGRPLVSSHVCPALDVIGGAVVEVPPDDVEAYAAAIRRLAEDPEFYEEKRRACAPLAEPFYDRAQSWGRQLQKVIEELLQR